MTRNTHSFIGFYTDPSKGECAHCRLELANGNHYPVDANFHKRQWIRLDEIGNDEYQREVNRERSYGWAFEKGE